MNDDALWMNQETHDVWHALRNSTRKGSAQKAHNKQRSAFSAYLFQVIGDKDVVKNFIKHPYCNAAQYAEKIQQFIRVWHDWKYADNDTMQRDSHNHRSRSRSR